MRRTAEQAAHKMERENPAVVALLGKLTLAKIPFIIVGSRAAQHASLMLDTNNLKRPDDWDLQIPPHLFWRAVKVTKAEVEEKKDVTFTTGDDKLVYFSAHDAHVSVDQHNTSIQFMCPLGPAYVDSAILSTELTRRAHQASQLFGSCIRIGNYIETATLYGMRQGGDSMGKQDFQRAAAVRAVDGPHPTYAKFRTRQVGWDERMHAFDATVTSMAINLRADAAMAITTDRGNLEPELSPLLVPA